MLKSLLFGAAVLILALSPAVQAQARTDPPAAVGSVSARLDALMVSYPGFSGVVLVAKDGRPVLRKAYGQANREWNIANAPDTKFRLGSLTKAFTAAAILQLQEAGKLSVEDPISKHYPDAPQAWSQITLKHLLTHTSGIPSYTGLPQFFVREARLGRTPAEIVKLTQDRPLEFEPGAKYAYDNTGYILLGYVIEKVSQEPYAQYVEKHIFQPLGMKSSGYDVTEKIIPLRASGYQAGPDGPLINAPFLDMSLPYAAGSLYSTVDDLLLWDQALKSDKLLSEGSRGLMFKDYGFAYGFGWGVDKRYGHTHIGHSGGINGFSTRLDRYPDDGLTVIVLSNVSSGPITGAVAGELGAIYLGVSARTAASGGRDVLRRVIDGMQAGSPDYNLMNPALADATRSQLPDLRRRLAALGPLKSVGYLGSLSSGADRYKVSFENGELEYLIGLAPDGRINTLDLRVIPK